MTKRSFFSESVAARVGVPAKKLLRELLRDERRRNRKATQSDIVRIAIIALGRERLGVKADIILRRGVKVE